MNGNQHLQVGILKDYYVYELYDRNTGEVFYVGEGSGKRANAHIDEANRVLNKLRDDSSLKERIKKNAKIYHIVGLLKKGEDQVGVRVIGRFDSKNEARAVETVLINWIYGIESLTNVSRGRGADYVRPKSRADENIQGIDIEKKIKVFGNTGYLSDKIDKHEKYDHHRMAEEIADHLRSEFQGLEIEDPCFWESGRYVAVFVELVPERVRMVIQLTDSGRNQHVYNLKPMSETNADIQRFQQFVSENLCVEEIELTNGNRNAKLPHWKKLTVKNEDLEQISKQVNYALDYFSNVAR